MKKVILASALLLLSSGCVKTASEVIDENSVKIPTLAQDSCQTPKAPQGAVLYRNDFLGFEFQPGKYVFKEIQQQDASGSDVVFAADLRQGKVIVRSSDESFEQIQQRLQKDQSNGIIKKLEETQIDCQKAFSFEDPGAPGLKNVELITGRKMYLITRELAVPEILATFHFYTAK